MGQVKCRCGSCKLATFATRSVVNLVRSQVYHSERPPHLFVHFCRDAASRGFVSDSQLILDPCPVWLYNAFLIAKLRAIYILKAKFHYAIWFEPEPDSVMEFGFYHVLSVEKTAISFIFAIALSILYQ